MKIAAIILLVIISIVSIGAGTNTIYIMISEGGGIFSYSGVLISAILPFFGGAMVIFSFWIANRRNTKNILIAVINGIIGILFLTPCLEIVLRLQFGGKNVYEISAFEIAILNFSSGGASLAGLFWIMLEFRRNVKLSQNNS